MPLNHPVTFEPAQGLCQDALGHTVEAALDLVEPAWLGQDRQHHHRPLVGDLIEDRPARTVGPEPEILLGDGSVNGLGSGHGGILHDPWDA